MGHYHNSDIQMKRTEKERQLIKEQAGPDIWIKVTITKIRRDPRCDTQAPIEEKMIFWDKIRFVGKELVQDEEYSNAKNLYTRGISIFKNMPKKQKEELNETQKAERMEILHILHLNCSLCMLKKYMYKDAIKFAKESLIYKPDAPKAHYRMGLAYKEENDLDRAEEQFKKALDLAPNDPSIRAEYKELMDIKNRKEKEWYGKMQGFYNKKKMD